MFFPMMLAGLLAGLFYSSTVVSQSATPSATQATVLELFTSHGCSSCPSADRLLGQLLEENKNVVALEYHVTYWDTLVHGNAGSFKDPFSDEAYTLRQHAYNGADLAGRGGVYTPQMIVNGSYVTVGSQSRFIRHALEQAEPHPLDLSVAESAGGLDIRVAGDLPDDARVWLLVFDIEQTTDITGGENKDLTLVNHHVVRQMREIGHPDATAQAEGVLDLRIDAGLKAGQGCAVLVQPRVPGKILGALNCPRSVWQSG